MIDYADPEVAGYCDVPGGRVWYRINGRDRPGAPLVAITGGPGLSHHYFLPLLRFAKDRPVVLYDQLDTGNADRPKDPSNWTLGRPVEELECLRAALALDRVIPVGHSWGGLVGYEYALAHPDRCAALILWSPFLSCARWTADTRDLIAGLPDYVQRLIAACEARGAYDDPAFEHANAMFAMRHVRVVDPRPPELARAASGFATELYNAVNGPSEFSLSGVVRGYEGIERIGELKTPTLFFCGEHDEARPATMREFAGRAPQAEMAEIPGAAHFSLNENPEATLAVLGDFLARHGA
ncbi:proline iminopeptidase-family hydrolase [Defluviimonas sp. WL0024]|uniref:Proline iminopeptidase-family hydrolase n=1 Tax=Albidovulum salinarum TaxID=2984153 RepID=A0ABT2X2W2_9RHOB|nr:proline iminopeptidase-family hydrolase [Defluviimonas sp. WL0024]MCU9848258.1 proline iminopeptidase-family hydrolase [Defluviimonas sp. WL0024]